jgi:hypothetical protein
MINFCPSGFVAKAICGLFSLMLISCYSDKTYRYLDPESIYVFSKGDTLLYKCEEVCDTFMVVYSEHYMDVIDKTHYFETVRVGCLLTNHFSDLNVTEYNIYRKATIADRVKFDDTYHPTFANGYLPTFQVGTKIIKDVYLFNTSTDNDVLKSFHYCFKYGIVAYTLHNNKTFVLDEGLIGEEDAKSE